MKMSQTLRWKWLCVRHLLSEPSDRESFSLSIIRPFQQSRGMNTKCSSGKWNSIKLPKLANDFLLACKEMFWYHWQTKLNNVVVQNRTMVHVTVKVILKAHFSSNTKNLAMALPLAVQGEASVICALPHQPRQHGWSINQQTLVPAESACSSCQCILPVVKHCRRSLLKAPCKGLWCRGLPHRHSPLVYQWGHAIQWFVDLGLDVE